VTPPAGPERLRAWLALALAPGLAPRAARELVERGFGGDPAALLRADPGTLRRAGIGPEAAAGLVGAEEAPAVRASLEWAAARPGRHLLAIDDPRYPERLRDLPDAPLVLHVAGDPEVLALPQVGVVGSRRPTPAGRETARELGRALAEAGLVVTSGLARGVDAAAHEGALAADGGAGGLTVAVCATGLDRIYPPEHVALARRIVDSGGALVSETPLGTPPRPGLFPRRNRLIAALAHGVLVVEASVRSGALITARLAAELGREVMAVPGSIHSPLARGCHLLIRQGARLVETAADVLEEIAPRLGDAAARLRRPSPAPAAAPSPPADPEYRKLLNAMEETPLPVDVLVARTGLTPGEVSSMLLILELEGRVASTAGGLYARVPEKG